MTPHESNAAQSRRAARRGDEEAGVVTMLQELAPHLEVEPDPAFRTATRQRLVAMAAVRSPEPVRPSPLRRLLAARAPDAPPARWRTRATAGLAGAALTVTSLATLVALSTGARPGDVLYGLKRGTEQTQLALAGDARGQVLLDMARTRLVELRDLDGDAARAESTLATMDEQTREGAAWVATRALDTSDTATLGDLSAWATEQTAQLSAVRTEVPAPAADDVDGSVALLDRITERAEGLRAVLTCTTGPAPTGADELGPVPAGCEPAPTTGPDQRGSEPLGGTPSEALGPPPAVPSGAPTVPSTAPTAPTAPAGPTGQQPAPGSAAATQAPRTSSAPAPTTAPGGGGIPLPDSPLPSLLPNPLSGTSSSAPTSTTPAKPLLDVPIDLGACLKLPVVLRLGRC